MCCQPAVPLRAHDFFPQGRNIETPGEDSYLSGEYAAAWIKGMQESPLDPHMLAGATCKHFAVNSMVGLCV